MEGNSNFKINRKVEGNSNFEIAISFHSLFFELFKVQGNSNENGKEIVIYNFGKN